ncbi:MAG TPA: serine/threonine-protein kinase [Gemmatimonadales bacterium]
MADVISRLNLAFQGRYVVEQEIGRGGAASVYLADDVRHGRKVAIKVLRGEVAAAIGAERFLREITIAAQLHHPHVLPLHDSGNADGFLFYVMPFVEGESLRERLAREGRLPITDASRILADVVDALSHAHARGVVHRDIKPENVMLSGRDAWVTDFGVAKAVSETPGQRQESTAGMALGTPAYMAPEQAAADPTIDHRADLYAVGILAYELLTGAPPFTGMTPRQILAAHLTEEPAPIESRRGDIPAPLAVLVMTCLAKEPRDRVQSAAELLSYLEGHLTPAGTTPSDTRPLRAVPRPRPTRRAWMVGGLAVAVLVIGAIVLRPPTDAGLDPNLLAVAPFDVLVPTQELWREGLVDMLSASLDGAGPLRSVSPSVSISRWNGRADPTSAARLGRDLGAGLVIFGRLIGSGTDSVRLAASLYDVRNGVVLGDVDLRDHAANVDRMADSLAVQVMADLSRLRGLGSVQLQSFGTSNPGALRAFLQGEHFYRQAGWDSARAYYARATQLDRAFALAYSRLGRVHEWRKGGDRSVPYALRAGALNRGLAPRESLLVTVDSIDAALYTFRGDSTSWDLLRRLYTTLDEAAALYPLDPGVWYRLGEARYHWGAFAGLSDRSALDAFARSVELDSSFAPAYIHLIELESALDGIPAGRRAMSRYVALAPQGDQTAGIAIVRRLLDASQAASPALDSALGALPDGALEAALAITGRLGDSTDAALRLARAAFARDSEGDGARTMSWALAYRGRLREAYAVLDRDDPGLYSELALLDGIPYDTARAAFVEWSRSGNGRGIWHALAWWASRNEAASLDRAMRLWDSLRVQFAHTSGVLEWNQLVETASAYLALSAGDSAAALRRFADVRSWPWAPYYRERLMHARLLVWAGRGEEAFTILDEVPVPRSARPHPGEVLWQLERGRVAERLGRVDVAVQAYRFVTDIWRGADAELGPFVNEARVALQRLQGAS